MNRPDPAAAAATGAAADERERLAAVRATGLLDDPDDADLAGFPALAARACAMPMAAISLIDDDRQVLLGRVGIALRETPREHAFCNRVVATRKPLEVHDALSEPTLRDNPLVVGPPRIRSYAAVPLEDPHGHCIGTLFVADHVPRTLDATARDLLAGLAREAARSIERRTDAARLRRLQRVQEAATAALGRVVDAEAINVAFEGLLADLLAIADSEYGFVGEIRHTPEGKPYLKTHAITNIAWNEDTRARYEREADTGMEFRRLDTLLGDAMTSQAAVYADDAPNDPRRGGLPPGNPPLNAFVGLPVNSRGRMIGMVGLANRPDGYAPWLARELEPLLASIASIIEAARAERGRRVATEDLARQRSATLENERRFRAALESLDHVAVQAYGPDGRITFWNRASEAIYGVAASDAVGGDVVDLLFQPHERAAERELMARMVASGDVPAASEVTLARGDGGQVSVYAARVLVPRTDGPPEFFCFDVDVTERRRAEAAVRESAQMLRDVADTVHGAIQRYVLRADGSETIEYVSAGSKEVWELEPEEVVGHPERLWGMVLEEDRPAMRASVEDSARRLAPWRHQWRIRTPSGRLKVLSGTGIPRRGPQGEIIWITHFTDVTERYATEQALALSEERLRAIADSIPGAIFRYILNADGRDIVEYMSRGCEEIWEIDAASIVADAAPLWSMVLPEDVPAMRDSVLDSARTLTPWRHQWRIRTPSGRLKWLAGNGVPRRTPDGDIVWSSFIIDRTTQAMAEAALARSEARYRAIAENIPGAIFRYLLHPDGHHTVEFISRGAQAIWEHEPAAIEADAQLLFSAIAPEDRDAFRASLLESARNLDVWQHRWRIVTPSGRRKWLQGSGQPVRRENGDIAWDGYVFDVTERREAEAALAVSEARLRVLIDAAPDAIVVLDAQARHFVDFNQAALDLYGFDADALRSAAPESLRPARQPDGRDSAEVAAETIRRALSGERVVFEWTILRSDGREVPCEVHFVRLPDPERLLLRSSMVDLTARKAAEAARVESEQRLNSFFVESPAGMAIFDRELRWAKVNPTLAGFNGFAPGEHIGRRPSDLLSPGLAAGIEASVRHILETGAADINREVSGSTTAAPGVLRHWLYSQFPIMDGQGAISGVGVVVVETTERKRAEQALRESEARLGLIVQNMLDGFFVLDHEWRFLEVNEAGARAMGGSPAALVGRDLRDVFPGAEGRAFGRAYQAVLDGSASTTISDYHPILKRWYEARVQPAGDAIAVFFSDVTERRRAEDALRESERRFRSLVEDVGTIAVQGYDRERRIVFWNRASEQIYGWSANEAIGRRLEDTIIPEPMRQAVVEIHGRWMDAGAIDVPSEELVLVDRHGLPVPVYSSHIMQRQPDGEPVMYCLDVDLRDLRRTEQALQQANLALRQRNTELQQFVMIASHDLQEPLRKVQTFADRLQAALDGRIAAHEFDYLERLIGAATRMRTLIQALLDYSAVSFNVPQRSEVDLDAVLGEVLDDLEQAIAASGASVRRGALGALEADPVQMRQLLQNLVGNALKYRDPARRPEIVVDGGDPQGVDAGMLRIRVADNGIGFDDAHRERIFAPFQRLHARNEYGGTGIGLAIVRRIVDQHGGRIEARGDPGVGATFTVDLPRGGWTGAPSA